MRIILVMVGTADHSIFTQQTMGKKLLDYWKHSRHAPIRGFVTPPSYNTKLGSADRVWRSSSFWGLSEHMFEFVTGPRLTMTGEPHEVDSRPMRTGVHS
jgi:hypothetical protein